MKFLLIIMLSILVSGCLSNRALNALGNAGDRLSQHYMQRDLMERQQAYQMQQIQASQPPPTQAILFVYSNPQGASISEINTTGGAAAIAPAQSAYSYAALKDHIDASGCFLVNGFTATWADGTRKSTESIIKLCQGLRNDYQITITK